MPPRGSEGEADDEAAPPRLGPPRDEETMTFSEDLRRRANAADLPDKAKGLGDALADLVTAALTLVGSFAAENREKVDGALDRAQEKAEQNVSGRSADKITRVRATFDKGFDKLAEQGDRSTDHPGSPRGEAPRPGRQWPSTPVPDDMHSAFDDDESPPAGSPS